MTPADLSQFELLDVLRLIRSENVGPVTFHNLISFYGSPRAALDALPELAKRGGKKRPLKAKPLKEAEAELEAVRRHGAELLRLGDAHYPTLLSHIHDALPLLCALGNTALLTKEQMIGIVGARNASTNGCNFVLTTARELGKAGYVVASGLARGIDTAAHKGTLETGTVAVIAGGIDHIYPPENEGLYHQIAQEGVIIAEAPFNTSPLARHFPARNRIIAGMSSGLIVAEASEKSGSLITAHYALDYGRDVFAVPGSPLDPRSKGANGLIKQGATLIESAEDIWQQPHRNPSLKEPDSTDYTAHPLSLPSDAELASLRQKIEAMLGPEPVLLDALLAQCETSPHILSAVLIELELAGRLQRHPGGKISLIYEVK